MKIKVEVRLPIHEGLCGLMMLPYPEHFEIDPRFSGVYFKGLEVKVVKPELIERVVSRPYLKRWFSLPWRPFCKTEVQAFTVEKLLDGEMVMGKNCLVNESTFKKMQSSGF